MASLKKVTDKYFKRIDKGIEWLDDNIGRKQWLKKVDWRILDLSNSETCMLGQAFGDFWNKVRNDDDNDSKKMSQKKSSTLGFLLDKNRMEDESYDLLSRCWIIKLMKLNKCNF